MVDICSRILTGRTISICLGQGRVSSLLLGKRFCSAKNQPEQKTCLHDFHVAHGGKMVPFAGYSMPVQYSDQSIVESHLHTRSEVSLFDVSHMLQTKIYGKDRAEFMETLCPASVIDGHLKPNTGTLTVFTNDHGGIRDDLIVSNVADDYLYVVSNAGRRTEDLELMQRREEEFKADGRDVTLEPMLDHALIAVQGPKMMQLLQPGISINLKELSFMTSAFATVFGVPHCRVTRCGYTGEDGVEISVDPAQAVALSERLLKSESAMAKLAGLGARDTLRLEAALCLYGSDIDENVTPVEAGLTWLIAKRRRETTNFPGAAVILKHIKNGSHKKRVGLVSEKGRPPRHGATIHSAEGKRIGHVTSGCPSPSLGKNIAMGYIYGAKEHGKVGTEVQINVTGKEDGKLVSALVTKMPFVKTHYFIPKK